MSTVRSTRAPRAAFLLPLLLPLAVAASCKRAPPAPIPAPLSSSGAPSAEPAPPPPAAPRCRSVDGTGLHASLGARDAPKATEDADDDDDVALPFSPEVGAAAPFGAGFVVSALLPGKGGTVAELALVGPGVMADRTIDLGKVHGEVSPPRVAADGKSLVLAVPDGAPHGSLVRLGRVDDPLGSPRVRWGAEILQTSDDSEVLSVEVGPKTAVLAWDDWDATAGAEVVKIATFAPADVAHVSPSSPLSGAEEDAEGPLLAPRQGGFWVAWTARAKSAADHLPRADAPPLPSADPAAPVEASPSWIAIAPLDESGKPAGHALVATPKGGHVQGFDLAEGKDGGALIAYRDDATSPGTAGGVVRIAIVRADGSTDLRNVADEDIGPGVPSLLVDGAKRDTWLAVTSDTGAARLVALDIDGRPVDTLLAEPAVGAATLLAVRDGRFLATRSRGKGAEAFVVACEKGPPPGPSAAPLGSAR